MAFYSKAIELDPNFADALAGYALTAVQISRLGFDYVMSQTVARKRAYDAAGRALELDPNTAAPMWPLRSFNSAMGGMGTRSGLRAAPSASVRTTPRPSATLGIILAYSGETTEAVGAIEQALRLSPSPPPGVRLLAGITFYNAREYDGRSRS